jgi:hypothetical protein
VWFLRRRVSARRALKSWQEVGSKCSIMASNPVKLGMADCVY